MSPELAQGLILSLAINGMALVTTIVMSIVVRWDLARQKLGTRRRNPTRAPCVRQS